jgi:hypothetical protein
MDHPDSMTLDLVIDAKNGSATIQDCNLVGFPPSSKKVALPYYPLIFTSTLHIGKRHLFKD